MFAVNRQFFSIVLTLLVLGGAVRGFGQGTAFNYQGRLNVSGQPANGAFDMHFALYDAVTNGNRDSIWITNNAIQVSNGLFATTLDFSNDNFTGTRFWLDIAVRKTGETNYTTLWPRQPVLPVPYAIFANTASNVLGTVAAGQVTGTLPASQVGGTSANQVSFVNGNNTFAGTFNGDGAALTNLNGSQIASGTVADQRLSGNVALLDHNQTFSGANHFTNWANAFTGSFFGNGLVGWLTVSGTSQQAERDHGYLLTSSRLTTVTLPPNDGLTNGDIVRVSGAGPGGWLVAQNAGQSILGQFLSSTNATWLLGSPSASWVGLASSADGLKMVATTTGSGGIYTSTDAGQTWNTSSTTYSPLAVASSSDGSKLVGVIPGSGIIYSVDSGVSWRVSDAPSRNWNAVAASADGSRMVAVVNDNSINGRIYTSADSGTNWVLQSSSDSGTWFAVASSANGSNLVAAIYGGRIYTSINAGSGWTMQSGSPSANWTALASSSDGTRLVGTVFGGGIYTSSDAGVTWTPTSAPNANWYAVASSGDGSRLVAVAYGGGVYVSVNSGASWSQQTVPAQNWRAVACSADGSKMVAGYTSTIPQGGIYYWQAMPKFTVSNTGTNGFIAGSQGSAVELQYIGSGQFMPVSSSGTIWAN
jgi:hypothetical protein